MSRANEAHRITEGIRQRNGQSPAAEGLQGRVLIGERLAGGVEPPEELLPGILLAGKRHKIFSGPGDGKTFLALWIALEVVRQDKTVLCLDAENGPGVVTERLEDLGATPEELDQRFHYYPSPDLTLEPAALDEYEATLDKVKPDLVVFDSWVDFLTLSGLDENSSTEVTSWVHAFADSARDRGSTVLILDHVPTDANRSRGSTQKLGKVDVSWHLKKGLDFDRRSVGQIELRLEKDREGWLPKRVRFAIGGGESGFIFRRDATVFEQPDPADGLTEKQRQALEFLKERDDEGAPWKVLLGELGCSRSTLSTTLRELMQSHQAHKEAGRYYATQKGSIGDPEVRQPIEPNRTDARTAAPESTTELESGLDTVGSHSSAQFDNSSIEPIEPGKSRGGSVVPPPLRGEPTEPDAELPSDRDLEVLRDLMAEDDSSGTGEAAPVLTVEEAGAEMRRRESGPEKALATYLEKPGPERLGWLAGAVMVARGLDATEWRRHLEVVKEAAGDPDNHRLECDCERCL